MLKLFAAAMVMLLPTMTSAQPVSAAPATETVVLLHGLGQTRWSMAKLASALRQSGYRVVNRSYPTYRQSLETLGGEWLPALLAETAGPDRTGRVHFVTHSMGGILLRVWLERHGAPAHLGRVVMIAPPNAGSELSDRLGPLAPFRWLLGPNLTRLGEAPDALPRRLGPWPATGPELGIIAGTAPLWPLRFGPLRGEHDGMVTVASSHLAGERDHAVLPHSHTGILFRPATAALVHRFLHAGRFSAAEEISGPVQTNPADGGAFARTRSLSP